MIHSSWLTRMPTIFGSVPSNQYPIQDIFKTILQTKLVLSLGRVKCILDFQKGGGGAYWKFSKTVSAEFYIEKKKIVFGHASLAWPNILEYLLYGMHGRKKKDLCQKGGAGLAYQTISFHVLFNEKPLYNISHNYCDTPIYQ